MIAACALNFVALGLEVGRRRLRTSLRRGRAGPRSLFGAFGVVGFRCCCGAAADSYGRTVELAAVAIVAVLRPQSARSSLRWAVAAAAVGAFAFFTPVVSRAPSRRADGEGRRGAPPQGDVAGSDGRDYRRAARVPRSGTVTSFLVAIDVLHRVVDSMTLDARCIRGRVNPHPPPCRRHVDGRPCAAIG